MNAPGFGTLADRVDRLERDCRRWRRASCVLTALGAVLLIGLAADKATVFKEVEAETYWVLGPNGKQAACLTSDPQGRGLLMMFNERKAPILTLGADDHGNGSLTIQDQKGDSRIEAQFDQAGNPSITLTDKDLQLTTLGQSTGGSQGLTFGDKTGRPRVTLGLSKEGLTSLHFNNKAGLYCFSVQEAENGTAFLLMSSDRQGKPGFSFTVGKDGVPSLKVFDKKGAVSFQSPR